MLQKNMAMFLIVGLDPDNIVKQLKGDHRPINPQDDRAAVIAGLKAVDFTFILPNFNLKLSMLLSILNVIPIYIAN